jgi:transposase
LEAQLGDLEWVREAPRELYAPVLGRPSLGPVVFLKAMLAGFFLNCVTDSELAFRLADSLTVRRFLGYGLEEETPDRSTLVKTRQRWPVEVFEQIFVRVLERLAEAGLVKGTHLSTDTRLVDANASLESLRHREHGCTYREYVQALYSQSGEATPSEISRQDAKRPKKGSNQEWVSETDPEAAVAVHPDGHTALSYRVDGTMDTETGALVQIGVAPGNVRDSEDLPQRVAEAQANLEALGLEAETLTADRGHHSEENLVEVAALGLTPLVRERGQRGEPGFRPRDFLYVPERDVYQCPAGQELHRIGGAEGGRGGRYGTRAGVCQACPH